ncbi:RNA polymerase sigma factor [Candidatus Gottesmanbacteria bacterium]|nr:RNA polymerase sigma factor [Candidatus Gottesmanbacteria bacterium]
MHQDRELIEGILIVDDRSLRRFYTLYKPKLYSYIKKKLNSDHDAEEILQDTFMATIEALRDFAYQSSLYTYICSIANHKIIDFYRKKKLKNIFFSQIPEIEPLLSTFYGPEDKLDEELLKAKIKETFARISPHYHKILSLKYIYGYSVEEISQKLSISFKSAESQLFRARKAFSAAFI